MPAVHSDFASWRRIIDGGVPVNHVARRAKIILTPVQHFLYHPDMTTPSLRQLDIFAQMVAAGSVARCAADLGIAPEDVRRDLAALEARLGYRLFEDAGDEARLSAAGHKTARAMTLLSHDPDSDGTDEPDRAGPAPQPRPVAPDPVRQTIILAAPAPIFSHFQDALSAFEAANDDITITLDLHVQSADQAALALMRGKADIAYFYALQQPADFESRYGWSEPVSLYAGASHPLARAETVTRADLAGTPLLAMGRDNAMRVIVDAALATGRASMGAPVLETDNMSEIIAALRAGAGCFAAFGARARDLGRLDGIRRLALDIPLPAVEVRQAVSPRAVETPAVDALADFLFL